MSSSSLSTKYPACDLVVFGATGDLSKRKLYPALLQLYKNNYLTEGTRIIGCGSTKQTNANFVQSIQQSLSDDIPDGFLDICSYISLDVTKHSDWQKLGKELGNTPRIFYLALKSELYEVLCQQLKVHKLANQTSRLVIEKPIGHDAASARALNITIHNTFNEQQIFRIDHYLGKETVQNLMALRFANALFEPLWNNRFIDHVQITVSEHIGIEGRSKYYEGTGAIRDMVQNHILQLLCLIAMEPPYSFAANALRDEKLKVLRSLQPIDVSNAGSNSVRGQYLASEQDTANGYLDDANIKQSNTETYVAIKTHIDNWRWSGTPFYIRTGKALHSQLSEIAVSFKTLPHSIFAPQAGEIYQNQLVIRVQPNEGILLHIMIKDPKRKSMGLLNVPLDMTFAETMGSHPLSDAYERLLLDVIRNDQTLFMRHDEVEQAWQWIDPIIAAWEETHQPMQYYKRGSQGPNEASRLISRNGDRFWREL